MYEGLQGQMPFDFRGLPSGLYEQGPNCDGYQSTDIFLMKGKLL